MASRTCPDAMLSYWCWLECNIHIFRETARRSAARVGCDEGGDREALVGVDLCNRRRFLPVATEAHPQNSTDELETIETNAAAWAVWARSGDDCLRIALFVELPALGNVIWWGRSELNKGNVYFFLTSALYHDQTPAAGFNCHSSLLSCKLQSQGFPLIPQRPFSSYLCGPKYASAPPRSRIPR
jgi:hypothetical protein